MRSLVTPQAKLFLITRSRSSFCLSLIHISLLHQAAQEDIMGYLVKPVEESALLGAVEVALCQEDHIMKAERECEKTKKALEDRKYIEKAKGLLKMCIRDSSYSVQDRAKRRCGKADPG